MKFSELQLKEPLLNALVKQGYKIPTPIQQQAIPIILERKDVMGCAQTGTGKTAAFVLPVLQQILTLLEQKTISKNELKCLIIAPTRELAIQISENVESLAQFTNIKHTVVFGGVNVDAQITVVRKMHPQVLVATPGRLLDLIGQNVLSLKQVKFLILDEADRMLEMGFIKDIKRIIQMVPPKRQTLMFSATMPDNIKKLADDILRDPEYIAVAPAATTAETVSQAIYPVEKENKIKLLIHLVKKLKPKNMIVFSKTKHGADKIVKLLDREFITAAALHGNKSQNARIRALDHFKSGKVKILVATDIAARGLDIEGVDYVVNYDIPVEPESYVHRIGRTGRAGATGKAMTFCDPEEWEGIEKIQKITKQTIPLELEHPYVISLSKPAIVQTPTATMPVPERKTKKPTSRQRRKYQNSRGRGSKGNQNEK